jgi:hypothetical protein
MATTVVVCASLGRAVFLLVSSLLCHVVGFVVAVRRCFCWLLSVGYCYSGPRHLFVGLRASILLLRYRYLLSLFIRPCHHVLHLGSLSRPVVRYHLRNPLFCR